MLKNVFVIPSFFFIISHSRVGKKHAKESLIIYRNHVLLCRLNEILSLKFFLLQTTLVMLRKFIRKIEIRNKYININIQKMKLLSKVTQRHMFSKITTFETLSAMPHSQNSIGN